MRMNRLNTTYTLEIDYVRADPPGFRTAREAFRAAKQISADRPTVFVDVFRVEDGRRDAVATFVRGECQWSEYDD